MEPGPPHKRRRPAVTCTECRRRKIACDLAQPCGPCQKSQLRCVYNNNNNGKNFKDKTANNNRADKASGGGSNGNPSESSNPDGTTSSNAINENGINYGLMLKVFGQLGGHTPRTSHPCEPLDKALLDLGIPSVDASTIPTALSDLEALSQLDVSFTRPTTQPIDATPLWTHTGFPSTSVSSQLPSPPMPPTLSAGPHSTYSSLVSEHEFGDRGLIEQTPWAKGSVQYKGLRSPLRVYAGQEAAEEGSLQAEDDTFQRVMEVISRLEQSAQKQCQRRASLRGWPPAGPLTASAARDMLPPRARCDVLLDAYLKTFESVVRIMDVSVLMERYERFWERSVSQLTEADEDVACQLLLIMVLGGSVCLNPNAPGDQSFQQEHSGWIVWVKQWVEQKIVAGTHAHLDVAQIVCLLALTRNTQHQHILSYYDPTQIGFKMGLHREPRTPGQKLSSKNTQMRRRLWATMLELSLQLCLDEGLPPPLTPETYDCEAPSNLDDEVVDVGFRPPWFASSTILVLLARTQRLRLRILHLIHSPAGIRTYEETDRLTMELNAACDANLKALRATSQPHPTNFQIKMLDIFTRPFVLALHGPYANQATDKAAYYYSRQMRMETASLLLAHPIRASDLDAFESTFCLTGAGTGTTTAEMADILDPYEALRVHGHARFANVQRQAAAALVLDLISELEENSFPTLHSSSRKYLRGVVGDAVRVFERRMRCAGGTHSMREFMLFAAGAAYVDTLLGAQEMVRDGQDMVAHAVIVALASCTEVVGLDNLAAPLDSYLGC